MTLHDVRMLALAFPATEESSHFDHPDFRVAGKIFATVEPRQDISVLRLTLATQARLFAEDPETYSPPGKWGRTGWTKVAVARVDSDTFAMLLAEAWRQAAPKRIAAAWEAQRK